MQFVPKCDRNTQREETRLSVLLPDVSELGLALELTGDVPEGGKDHLAIVYDCDLLDEGSVLEQYSLDSMN